MDIGEQLGRFWYWLNQSAGAIQALSAIGTLGLTVYLAIFTMRSLRVAERAQGISQQQLLVLIHPNLAVYQNGPGYSTTSQDPDQEEEPQYRWSMDFIIENTGSVAFQLFDIHLTLSDEERKSTIIPRPELNHSIVVPKQKFEIHMSIEVDPYGTSVSDLHYSLAFQCSDTILFHPYKVTWDCQTGVRVVAVSKIEILTS